MPKNIVLLSDGTGNSSAKLSKTNVWRMYEALDLRDPSRQVACYDDGVGTSGFLPLKLLGGALGFGLKRNLLQLYRFLCEHYEPGDHIYAFGFSRGAFTIRVLVGLVASEGIVRGARASELPHLARWAYRSYRRKFNTTGGLVTPLRALRDAVLRWLDARARRPAFSREHTAKVRVAEVSDRNPDTRAQREEGLIAFVGVWDTVDAYGLPIQELTDAVDRWIWPLSMRDQKLSSKVARACHALSLDDERHTFHPRLWDESEEPRPPAGQAATLADERISQVWFAGVHSNVGGGYPDDALSLVAFDWMATEAAHAGLRLLPDVLATMAAKRDPLGRVYNPRAGLGGYYRYNPRRIGPLTDGQALEHALVGPGFAAPPVTVPVIKVHESAIDRVRAGTSGYAPIVLPDEPFAVVKANRRIEAPAWAEAEAADDLEVVRREAQEDAWDLVWWRRLVYFAAVAVSAILLVRPLAVGVRDEHLPRGSLALSGLVSWLHDWLPGVVSPWTAYYVVHPLELLWGIVGLIVLITIGTRLHGAIADRMREAWSQIVAGPAAPAAAATRPRASRRTRLAHGAIRALRTARWYRRSWIVLRRVVFPTVFGLPALGALVVGGLWLATAVATKTTFEAANIAGRVCQPSADSQALARGRGRTIEFHPSHACAPTGIAIEAGATYRVEIALPPCGAGEWRDCTVPVVQPAGFATGAPEASGATWAFVAALPFRRVLGADWFAVMARVGREGLTDHELAAPQTTFQASRSGELFLFVNDAVLPWPPAWDLLYRNNRGAAARVRVVKLAEPGEEPRACPGVPCPACDEPCLPVWPW
ncbi:MAG: DUF2235 domain-containing protein [Acidobacteria bacterium]|nr:DUF2235 domain-containing protein [Acidobacteriota bacterium]